MTEGRDVSVDWLQPDHVYLALPDGIAVSVDAGETWQRREDGLPARGKYTQTLEIDRTRAGHVLADLSVGEIRDYIERPGGAVPTETSGTGTVPRLTRRISQR